MKKNVRTKYNVIIAILVTVIVILAGLLLTPVVQHRRLVSQLPDLSSAMQNALTLEDKVDVLRRYNMVSVGAQSASADAYCAALEQASLSAYRASNAAFDAYRAAVSARNWSEAARYYLAYQSLTQDAIQLSNQFYDRCGYEDDGYPQVE